MKKLLVVLAVLVLVMAPMMLAAQPTIDAAKNAGPLARVVDVVKLTGTVKAIDQDKKIVSIEGPRGRTIAVNTSNARNLDQVRVGDVVNMEFIDELAVSVRKTNSLPSETEREAVALAPKGQKPSALVVQTIALIGNVEFVDSQKRTISLKGPAGNVRTFRVDESTKNFDQIKTGDQIVLRFTEAIALSLGKS